MDQRRITRRETGTKKGQRSILHLAMGDLPTNLNSFIFFLYTNNPVQTPISLSIKA